MSSAIHNLTLLKTGATFPELRADEGCYETWFAALFGDRVSWTLIDAPEGDLLPAPHTVERLVITGSPVSIYERLSWSVACSDWLKLVWEREIPILGVCYGHQLLADALGGEVGRSPQGREMGATEVTQCGDDLIFSGLMPTFKVWQTHVDEIIKLPAQAEVIATNDHSAVQAMAIGDHCRSVQWHPEMNRAIMDRYAAQRADQINREWGEGAADQLRASLPEEVPSGSQIAANFLKYFCGLSLDDG